ncbi:MAG TPA: DUF5666 domain-containing protein [Thermoanaerobaculia bacterium]|nr:DUF5666 domain-containing protein [Thermoanaerobaculia bacterium]
MKTSSKMASAAAVLALLLLCGCGSTGIGDILGGGQQPTNSTREVRGTVDQVDSSSIVLTNVDTGTYGQSNGNSVRVYFDSQTPVTYQGRSYRPQDLDRGDEISARVEQSGNRLIATSMTVTRDTRGGSGGTGFPNDGYPSGSSSNSVRGTVRSVDSSRRTIDVDEGYNRQTVTVAYDANTNVSYNGRSVRAQDLERGDEIDVRGRSSNGRLMADSIEVVRDVNGGGTNGGSDGTYGSSNVRGTVRYLDASRRTIELEQASWNNFDTRSGNGSNNGNVVVQYDNSTQVEYQGKSYAPSNLERGDVVDVQLRNRSGSTYFADRIVVVRDVNR